MIIAENESFIAKKESHIVTVLLKESMNPDKDKVEFIDKDSDISIGEETMLSTSIGYVPELIDILNKVYKGWQ